MSTALYLRVGTTVNSGTLPSGHQSATAPGVTATGGTTNRNLSIGIGNAETNLSLTSAASTSAQNGLFGMFMSEPLLGGGTIGGGSLTFDVAEQESNASADFWINGLEAYVWRPGTGAKVGTIKAFGAASLGGTEPTSINATQSTHITGVTTSAVTYADGDIIVVEIWSHWTQAMATAYTLGLYYDGATAITSENQAASAAVITFAETVTFKGAWAPTDKNSNITLSGSNLIATGGASTANDAGRSATARSTGKYYFEGQLNNGAVSGSISTSPVGLADAAFTVAAGTGLGGVANTWGYFVDGSVWTNNAQLRATGLTFVPGDWTRLAVDFDAGKAWVGNQSAWDGDPAAGTGASFTFTANTRLHAAFNVDTSGNQITANFGASAFNHAIPSGFTSWDGSQSTTSATTAATDGADVNATATSVTTGGAFAATDAKDTAAVATSVTTGGTIAATDAGDTAAVAGRVTTGAAVSATDGPDVAAVVAATWTTAQIASTDGGDASALATSVTTGAALSATDAPDTAAVVATVTSVTNASIASTDAADQGAVVAANWTTAQAAAVDGPDTLAAAARVTTGADLVGTDGADNAVLAAANWTTAALASIDAADEAVAAADVPAVETTHNGGAVLVQIAKHRKALKERREREEAEQAREIEQEPVPQARIESGPDKETQRAKRESAALLARLVRRQQDEAIQQAAQQRTAQLAAQQAAVLQAQQMQQARDEEEEMAVLMLLLDD